MNNYTASDDNGDSDRGDYSCGYAVSFCCIDRMLKAWINGIAFGHECLSE
jgi:hypothetical protein